MEKVEKFHKIPKAFIWRRLHSLMGLWFLIFLLEHLFTNSQVALFFGGHGKWFVRSVDFLRNLPYLQIIEIVLLGIPILYHAVLGLYYTFSGKYNNVSLRKKNPSLPYGRNWAYTMQRATAWILFAGVILHVIQMRFIEYPYKYYEGKKPVYFARLHVDAGLYETASRLGVQLYDQKEIAKEKKEMAKLQNMMEMIQNRRAEILDDDHPEFNPELKVLEETRIKYDAMIQNIRGLESRSIDHNEVMAKSSSFGALELLNVRQSFQSIILSILYTIFVLSAVFHGFNGLWTFLITWGLMLSKKSQNQMVYFCYGLMFILGFLGLMSIWGTFILS